MSKFSNKKYSAQLDEPKEKPITTTVSIMRTQIERIEKIHDNKSEFIRDAIDYYLIEVERQLNGVK